MSLLESTNLGDTMDALWNRDDNVWVFGFSPDGRRALLVNVDKGFCSVVSVDSVGSLGRWECRIEHFRAHQSLYAERFPQRP